MILTINTDASFSSDYKIAVGAYWIVYKGHRLKGTCELKSAQNSTEAECKTIGNALWIVLKNDLCDLERIVVNTDCLTFKKWSDGGVKCNTNKHPYFNDIKNIKKLLKKKYSLTNKWFDVRHVKAHAKDLSAPRSYVNDWLDKSAKTKLRELVNKIKNENLL